ncbi:hypothetical protein ABE42_24595, partial [Bacillus thuringiensis]|nr:hypothetical protein [Bacillus thuringiensis]
MSLKNKFLCTSLALSIGIGFVMPSFSVSAATNISVQSLEENKQINELAEQLKFLNEEALVIQNGERVFDFNKIENKYGANYANNLKNDIVMIEEMNDAKAKNPFHRYKRSAWTDCMIDAIKDHFGVAAVTAALEGGLWAYLQKKAYKEAAKLLVKFAVGSNAVGLAGTLVYYGGK